MTRRQTPPGLLVEQLEDRLTPAGSVIPAGQFDWTQYSPTGTLAQLVWEGQNLVYRTRANSAWYDEPVATATTFTQSQYDSRDQVEKASRSAQLVFTADGTAHVFLLDPSWVYQSNAYQTVIRHYERTAGGWKLVESITTPWLSTWGPNSLVAEAGANNTLHLMFVETYQPALGVGNQGTGIIWYATNKTGTWTFDKIADTSDLKLDVWFTGGRWAPRFLSMAIDKNNNAHVTYTPQFYIQGAFSKVYSELRYATNAGGSWHSQLVAAPPDGTGDAGLGASIAIGPDGQPAIASYFVDRYTTGSPFKSQLQYHTPDGSGGWTTQTVVNTPDGYAAADGPNYTGFSPQLYFDNQGRPNIVFTDEASQHNPVSYANEVAGQLRLATLSGGRWGTRTIYRQTDPLVNQLFYPVAATFNGQTTFAGLQAVTHLDGNNNPVTTDFALLDFGAPAGSAQPQPLPPPVSPPPVDPTPTPTSTPTPTPTPTPAPPTTAPATPMAIQPAPGPAADPNVPTPPSKPAALAVGTDAGVPATVGVYRSDGSLDFTISPFGTDFTGGARVARADVTGDGVPDVIIGSGAGMQSRVRIWDGQTRALIFDTVAFGDFSGGVVVAAGDINGDGTPDVIIGPDVGGGPRIQVWSGKTLTKLMPDFYGLPYPEFRGGLRLASADINHDGFAELVVAPGAGGGPRLTVYDGRSFTADGQPRTLVNDFFVFDESLRTGLYLTAGDVDGDGFADIVAGTGSGGGPRVRVISGADLSAGHGPVIAADFFAGSPDARGGVRVGVVDFDGDGRADVATGPGDSSVVSVYGGASVAADSALPMKQFEVFPGVAGGVFVG